MCRSGITIGAMSVWVIMQRYRATSREYVAGKFASLSLAEAALLRLPDYGHAGFDLRIVKWEEVTVGVGLGGEG